MEIIEYLLHFDEHLKTIIDQFGIFSYIILFLIIFAETGLIIIPFLPGDSLLFIVGTLSGSGYLNIWIVYFTLLAAAIIGDTVNYWVGHHLGAKLFSKENSKIFNKAYLEKTREFYAKHGGKTIILARFLPILRTFAPFVAGIGKMHYRTFIMYNIVGAFIWVTSLTFAGYFFGSLPIIKDNFEYAVIGIVFLSLVPMVLEYIKHKRGPHVTKKQLEHATYKDIKETLRKEHLND
ncbi:MAG TPA: DedA family protein [Candidatus Nitrosocosmicus sp.]|nr:DedA family protein [Candidatus Nitrosocosmicus sp.]